MGNEFLKALTAPGPAAEATEQLMLFGRFVGDWRLEWRSLQVGARSATPVVGELHFGWVLGGRAVQDVWIVPASGESDAGERPRAFHGSTIRFYDQELGAWRSTWVEPINGRVRKFIGRPTPDGIELISDDEAPHLRWSFSCIESDSFTWTGEYLDVDGHWVAEERMIATRTHPSDEGE